MRRQWSHWRTAFVLALMAAILVFMAIRRPEAVPAGLFFTPTPKPMPVPAAPLPTPDATPVPGAVTILENGRAVCTLSSDEEVEALLRWQLLRAETMLPEGEALDFSTFANKVEKRNARTGEETVLFGAAQSMLEQDGTLLSAYILATKTETEDIPFETEETEDPRIPRGARIVLQAGRAGLKIVQTTRRYQNGRPVGTPVIEESVLTPEKELVALGTYTSRAGNAAPGRSEGQRGKEGPEGFPLAAPVDKDILSNFGMRAGQMHYGLDFESAIGDTVYAPGGGVVQFAAERGNYGLVVEIDHGDGFVTRLAPLAELQTEVGGKVTKGQPLGILAPPKDEEAEPHLHMELLIDGVPYNPRRYLGG